MNTGSQIFTVSKFVEAIKERYPGAKKIAVIINFNHLGKTKYNFITNPLSVFVEKERLDVDTICDLLGVEQFTFSINQSQYNYMSSRKSYTYWSLVIDTTKQTKKIEDEDREYYPSVLYYIQDQKFIESLLPQPKEFNIDELCN